MRALSKRNYTLVVFEEVVEFPSNHFRWRERNPPLLSNPLKKNSCPCSGNWAPSCRSNHFGDYLAEIVIGIHINSRRENGAFGPVFNIHSRWRA